MANQILASTQDLLIHSISSNLSKSIFKGLQNNIDFSFSTSQLKVKLLNAVDSLSFDGLVQVGCSMLSQLSEALPKKSERTSYDEKLGKQFFDKFIDFDLVYQSRILYGLTRSVKDRRELFYRYYRRLQKFDANLPELLEIQSQLPWKKITTIPSFADVVGYYLR